MQTDSRVRFKAPESLLTHEESKEPRVIVREALLLALASDTPDAIIEMHQEWFEGVIEDDELHDFRIRTYDYDIITNKVANLSIKARSIVLAYGLHLRRLVLDQYTPLSARRLSDNKSITNLLGGVFAAAPAVVGSEPKSKEATASGRKNSASKQTYADDENTLKLNHGIEQNAHVAAVPPSVVSQHSDLATPKAEDQLTKAMEDTEVSSPQVESANRAELEAEQKNFHNSAIDSAVDAVDPGVNNQPAVVDDEDDNELAQLRELTSGLF